ARGAEPRYLSKILDYWAQHYEWREHEDRIRSFPWVVSGSSVPIRSIHQESSEGAPTVVLLHGWPDSVLRFERLLPLLTHAHVVIPALPGFPFAYP
ncbi:epoxide hydrolase N-terminal domain-containing protein, partial [Enterococcus faecium]|uniref:epoxide hydrolase N-terminal domain-containing protein n=1 Tax=Enterococcus faecium TaxID=1352 RepID=UPI0034E9514C